MKFLKADGELYVVTLVQNDDVGWDLEEEYEELKKILAEFDDVFQTPTGLPPSRVHNHVILLKGGATIPNVRPYRYPHY